MVGLGMDYSGINQWLEILLREKFFTPCVIHQYDKKKEKNVFCLECCTSICLHCLPSHRNHSLLQIRRYVYHDVIRVGDAEKLMNCSLVQPYTTNSAKVVFLKQRPMSRPFRGSGKFCITCDRSLQDPYLFCSLSCKVIYRMKTKTGIRVRLNPRETRSESDSVLEDEQMTLDSVLGSHGSISESTHCTSTDGVALTMSGGAVFVTAPTEFIKKKRSSVDLVSPRCSPAAEISIILNRRKGVPQRSPLY